MVEVNWTALKNFVTTRGASIQWLDVNDNYYLRAFDGTFQVGMLLPKTDPASAEQIDFETNFKNIGNKSLWQSDSDGAQIVRTKAAKAGWSFWAVPIEITTSMISANLYCKDSNLNNVPGISGKIYDDSNVEITVPGIANVNLSTATKTVIDFEPPFDYEIIGGALRINSNPGLDVRLWIIGAPDIPANLGGSKEFASGVNLKFMAPDADFQVDGRVSKFLQYNATTHQGKMRILLRHPPGAQVNMQIVIHVYRL